MADWSKIEELFHKLWGNASAGNYDKPVWGQLQGLLQEAKSEQRAPETVKKAKKKRAKDPEEGLYVVRLWDMFDGWMDLTEPISEAQAKEVWNERTGNGKHHIQYSDGDYYKIFPANTRMIFTTDRMGR